MAVIVSDSNNGSYDEMLATTNGFYKAEAYNLGAHSTTTLPLSTARYIPAVFANSGNLQGIALGIYAVSSAILPRGARAELELIKGTCTLSISSPGIVTLNSHGFSGDEQISITTTGTLPTGLLIGGKYFVKYIDANTFNLSLTSGGVNINFTGSQTGIHTLGVMVAEKELIASEINPEFTYNIPNGQSGINYFGSFVPFKFTTPYAIDTNIGKWRFRIADGITHGVTGTWQIMTSDTINPSYVAWCDNQVTSADGDILIVADKIVINKSFTTGSILGTGDTVVGVGGWICRNTDLSPENTCLLEWENPPTSSYAFTFGGCILLGKFAGFRVGSSTNRIPNAQRAILTRTATILAGTIFPGFYQIVGGTSSRSRSGGALYLYGEIPSKPYGILANDAAISQAKFYTTEDLSSDWQVGDYVYAGKQLALTQGTTVWQQIQSINGTEITLTNNLLSYTRIAGGYVFNRDRGWGIQMNGYTNAQYLSIVFEQPRFCEISGCLINNTLVNLQVTSSYYNYPILLENTAQYQIQDNMWVVDSTSMYIAQSTLLIPRKGAIFKRNYTFRASIVYSPLSYYIKTIPVIPYYSGLLEFKENINLCSYSGGVCGTGSTNMKIEIEDNVWQNGASSTDKIRIKGNYVTFKRNKFWGQGSTIATGGSAALDTSVNAYIEDNSFDYCNLPYFIVATAFALNAVSRNDKFGVERANTNTIGHQATGYFDFTIQNPTGDITIDPATDPTLALTVSKLRIVNENLITNKDRVYTANGNFERCGDGLADTTVHTNGTAKFSLRFEPGISNLDWEFDVPTGNIQNKTMSVLAWVKINSTNYWSGTYVMPRLIINYDDGTIIYTEASQNTDWQLLSLPFTPTSATGKITVTISGTTDVSGNDAYFYLDDMSVLYPAGYTLNLGGLDNWDKALPVTPPIATSVSAADIWNFPTANLNATGTTGKKLVDDLTTGKYIGLK